MAVHPEPEAQVVTVVEQSYVRPSGPIPRDSIWLSPLDMMQANRGHTPIVYLYRNDSGSGADEFFHVPRLKESMARALQLFYPLAGRLGWDETGRVEITSCRRGDGALFVVACSDALALDDIKDAKPSPMLRAQFVPRVDEPPLSSVVMAIQVTFLRCGGVAFGTAIHHAAVDALSAHHFFQTWAAFCRDGDGAAVEAPCHDRALLRARSPPAVHPDALSKVYYKHIFSPSSGPTASESFLLSGDQVASLKRLCAGASTFCAVSALMWRCVCAARRLPHDAVARVCFPANIRRRRKAPSPLPDRYFGNAVLRLCVAAPVRDVAYEGTPLASVAGRIRDAINQMDDELVQSAIDYFEMAGTDTKPLRGTLLETDLQIISWLGMPAYDSDYGWGKPLVMSRAESVRGGFMHIMNDGPPGAGAGAGVRVLICMEAQTMKELQRLFYANLPCAETLQ